MRVVLTLLLSTICCPAQQIEKVITFQNLNQPRDLAVTGTVLRSIALVPDLRINAEAKSMAVKGDTEQIALAEWLTTYLDNRSRTNELSYQIGNGLNSEVVRILEFPRSIENDDVRRIAAIVRSVAEIQRAMIAGPSPQALIVRSNDAAAQMAQWLFEQLTAANTEPNDMHVNITSGNETIDLITLTGINSGEELQALVKKIETEAKPKRVHAYYPKKMIVVRGTPEVVGKVEHVLHPE